MNPKISIIVPVYNTSLYLRRCLNSLKVKHPFLWWALETLHL